MVPRACNTNFFDNRIRFGRDIRLLNISAHAQQVMKSVPRMLSMRWNYSGRGKFMPLPLKSKILETPGSLVTDDIKMFPL
jgi:hypothetical protein